MLPISATHLPPADLTTTKLIRLLAPCLLVASFLPDKFFPISRSLASSSHKPFSSIRVAHVLVYTKWYIEWNSLLLRTALPHNLPLAFAHQKTVSNRIQSWTVPILPPLAFGFCNLLVLILNPYHLFFFLFLLRRCLLSPRFNNI